MSQHVQYKAQQLENLTRMAQYYILQISNENTLGEIIGDTY